MNLRRIARGTMITDDPPVRIVKFDRANLLPILMILKDSRA
jgi:hypothetical protein